MMLFTVGLNHITAPVSIRERVAFSQDRVKPALKELIAVSGVYEAAILSTCNRTELYCNLEDITDVQQVVQWLREFHQISHNDMEPFLYQHQDRSTVNHALRVACGLDSLVLGEPQILGQLKTAYRDACGAGTLGRQLGRLFQHAFAVAKQVRTDTAIGSSPVSVAFAAVSLAKQIFSDLDQQSALLIGAGETIQLVARHLKGSGIGELVVANRSRDRAISLAKEFDGKGISLPQISDALPNADILICSTASPLPLIGKGLVERALKQRKHRPMFIVDIAIPRDVEPEVGTLADVFLYTVDDLSEVIQENLASRHEAADQADEIIQTQVEHFMAWLRSRCAVSTICSYRDRAHSHQEAVLKKAKSMLHQGKLADDILDYLAYTLTNKLTHDVTYALNQVGREGREDLLKTARILLNLPDPSK